MKPNQIRDFRFLYEDAVDRHYRGELLLVFWRENEAMLCLREFEVWLSMQGMHSGQRAILIYGCKPVFIQPDHVDNIRWDEPVLVNAHEINAKEAYFKGRYTIEAQAGVCLVRKIGEECRGINENGDYVAFSWVPEEERRLSLLNRMQLHQISPVIDLLESERKLTGH